MAIEVVNGIFSINLKIIKKTLAHSAIEEEE